MSVIIPICNEELYRKKARAITSQYYKTFEIVIVKIALQILLIRLYIVL